MFSWELFTASQKRAISLIYRMVWLSLSGAPNGMGHIWPPVQKSIKKCEKVGKEILHQNSIHHWCSANLQQFCPLYTSISFLETEVEILVLGCKRKHDLIHRCKVNKAYKFVLYMSKQSINFKNVETSWFRWLFLHFHTKKMISVHQHMAFVTVNRFCLL